MQQHRVGEVAAIAVAGTDRFGEPAQLAPAAGGAFDPLPSCQPTAQPASALWCSRRAGRSGGSVDGDVQLVARRHALDELGGEQAGQPWRHRSTRRPTWRRIRRAVASRSSSSRTSSRAPAVETTWVPARADRRPARHAVPGWRARRCRRRGRGARRRWLPSTVAPHPAADDPAADDGDRRLRPSAHVVRGRSAASRRAGAVCRRGHGRATRWRSPPRDRARTEPGGSTSSSARNRSAVEHP